MRDPHLVIKFNMAVIKDVALNKDEITIGRKAPCDVVLDNQAVSSLHCKIRKDGDDFVIIDEASTNGTYVNGRKVTREKLKHKDQLRLARYTAEFLWEAKAPADKAPAPAAKPVAPPPPETTPQQMGSSLKGDRPLPPANGVIKIISGGEGQSEIKLTELMTYIGTGAVALIKIKGFMAPELAAAISRRKEGYFLKAVKPGYPKVNGNAVSDQIFLESGALIEVGSLNMVFYLDEPGKVDDGN